MAPLKYWIWLSTRRISAKTISDLLDRFGTPEAVYFARDDEYKKAMELPAHQLAALSDKDTREAETIIGECGELGYRIMTLNDADYPVRLKNIFDPPAVLYINGRLPAMDDEAAIAIVGTRNCTPYGIRTAERIGYEVAYGGGLVVSGLARGIDSAAARGALRAGGAVVGVLGCGLDVVYPPSNEGLFRDVAKTGAIISEYPPHSEPSRGHFPARNRILSGISAGTVVIEAPERSGALITAARALEQGRDVFAVPGNVDSDSCRGSNALLKEGALPALSGRDILDEYVSIYPDKLAANMNKSGVPLDEEIAEKLVENELPGNSRRQKSAEKEIDNPKTEGYIDLIKSDDLSQDEKMILSVIAPEGSHIDEIIEKSGMPAAQALSVMTMLELNGAVRQEPGKRFFAQISIN